MSWPVYNDLYYAYVNTFMIMSSLGLEKLCYKLLFVKFGQNQADLSFWYVSSIIDIVFIHVSTQKY